MMKNTITCLGLLPLLVAGLSYADTNANLKVSGDIKPPTCSINNQNEVDIVYNYTISPEMLNRSEKTPLDKQKKRIEIVCDATTYLSFEAKDNRIDSVSSEQGHILFGLGTYGTDNKENIGAYSITMSNATVKANSEEADKNVLISTGNTVKSEISVEQSKKIAWAETSKKLAAGKIFAADFEVYAVLNIIRTNNIEDISLDGSATLSFGFGI
ncbi:TPA: fimbrial protein [Providencia stuartii]|uniref:fimbrial protein n=1 Tax=Providencia stuartii TaxID=588 RepID=UPI000538B357|nr:fimbrial protein [Providencia stuartii]AXO18067.1 fimbrial protein [Providencia stuartii]MBN5590603.1 fimbrial protein [Providencia stuartii]HEM6904868.1 fimbrial protein [Providencia stuartii]HEM7151941.1 fimbrial protein [Providencia stuartii]HEM7520309.1 fimbrial protein [Providencia stuartii]